MDILQKTSTISGFRKNKLPMKIQSTFLVQTANMLENGFSLQNAIDFQAKVQPKYSNVFVEMIQELKRGKAFYEVLNDKKFDPQICVQIYFANKHGFLATTLKDTGIHLQRKEFERRKLMTIMYYPIVLLIALIIVGLLMQHLLLPRFQMFYQSLGVTTNKNLEFLIHIIKNFSLYLIIFLLFTFLLFLTHQFIKKKMNMIHQANMYANIPFFRSFYTLYQTSLFGREWGLLLKGGFSIRDIIKMMEEQTFQPLLRECAINMYSYIELGYTLPNSIESFQFLTKELKIVIAQGEFNDELGEELLYFSKLCLERLEEKTMRVFQLIQPIVFILIGLFVVGIYLSIFLPLFQVIDAI